MKSNKKLDAAKVAEIRADKIQGMKQIDIAVKHGVSPASVCRILRGSRHNPQKAQVEAQ